MTCRSDVFYLDWGRRADKLELLARRIVESLRSRDFSAENGLHGSQEDGDYAKP
jgi:hypothetical protein